MVSSLKDYGIFFTAAVICMVIPLIPVLLIISDLSFIEILQHIYANKFVVLSLAVLNSVISNLDGDQFFLLRENILPGAVLGLGMGYLIAQALSESY